MNKMNMQTMDAYYVSGWVTDLSTTMMVKLENSPLMLPIIFTISLGLVLFFTTIYRLFFHPLRKFPGPRLAAITQWYQFYHDVILGGKYLSMIPGFEATYGEQQATCPSLIVFANHFLNHRFQNYPHWS
jgi:hypothetical protein